MESQSLGLNTDKKINLKNHLSVGKQQLAATDELVMHLSQATFTANMPLLHLIAVSRHEFNANTAALIPPRLL